MNTPMLAATIRTFPYDLPKFPLMATQKVDGVRALIVEGSLVSRSMKKIPNRRVAQLLEQMLPEGADGEIFCGDLYSTTSTVMSLDGGGTFVYYWFDWAYDVDAPYSTRTSSMRGYMAVHGADMPCVKALIPNIINGISELVEYERSALDDGFEGVILRDPMGRYKHGRSTLREGLMVKLKRHADSEAMVVGTEELVHGGQNRRRGGTLGSIIAAGQDGTSFKIGTGYTAEQRSTLWAIRDSIVGMAVKYRHAGRGSKGRPRGPVFLDMRHTDDM